MEREIPNPKEIVRSSYTLEDSLTNLNRELAKQANLSIYKNPVFQEDSWLQNENDEFGIIIVDKGSAYKAIDSVTGEVRRGYSGAEGPGSLSILAKKGHPCSNHYINFVKRCVKSERTYGCKIGNFGVQSPTAYLPSSWNIPITDEIRYFVYDNWRVHPKENTHIHIDYAFTPNIEDTEIIFPKYLLGDFFEKEWTIEMCNELNRLADLWDEYKEKKGIIRIWDGIQRMHLPYNVEKVTKN